MGNPTEIARGLTKAQHTALWNLDIVEPEHADGWRRAPHDGWRRAGQACSALCRLGLAERMSPGTVFQTDPAYRLSLLGFAVREALLASPTPEDHCHD